MPLRLTRTPEEIAAADAMPRTGPWTGLVRPTDFDGLVRTCFAFGLYNFGSVVMALIAIPFTAEMHAKAGPLLLIVGAIGLNGLICFAIPLIPPATSVRRIAAIYFTVGDFVVPLAIAAGILVTGNEGDPIAVLYPMTMSLTFWTLRLRISLVGMALALAEYALILTLQPGHTEALAKWLLTATATLATSTTVGWIAGRADKLREELAALNNNLEQRVAEQVQEVRDSRARIVAASDESRRRVERNIHDGAQQQLVAISLDLRILAEGVEQLPPQTVRTQLEQAHGNLKDALDNLRELARGLHPPVLSTDGLGAALEQLAARAPLPVTVKVPTERFAENIETAVYFIAAEALANTAKHAQATKASIDVAERDGILTVTLADDGNGGAAAVAGGGLAGLADRVAALDGTLRVDSSAGAGTTITVSLPVPRPGLSSEVTRIP